jgi:hypothetical protein
MPRQEIMEPFENKDIINIGLIGYLSRYAKKTFQCYILFALFLNSSGWMPYLLIKC